MSTVQSNIKILRKMLKRLENQQNHFPTLDKTLRESESYIKYQLLEADRHVKNITELDNAIVSDFDETCEICQLYDEEEVYDKLRDLLAILVAQWQDLLVIVAPGTTSTLNLPSSTFTNSSSNNGPPDPLSNSGIRLPTLTITPFDGTYEKWAEFRDIFESSIHDNSSLCNSMKLRYLQSLLKGEALKVIKRNSDGLIPENYASTWELLKKRYDHKRSLVNSYFHILFCQDVILKESAKELKRLHDSTYDAISSLRNMKLNPDGWSDMLVYLVCSKLPLHTKEIWEEKIGGTDELPKFTTLMEFIETRFRTLEGIEATRTQSITFPPKKQINKKTTLQTETTPKSKNDQTQRTQKCKYCQGASHYLRYCVSFKKLTAQERVNYVNQNKHNCCSNCLGSHIISDCTSKSRCLTCKMKHHTLLHIESNVNNNVNASQHQIEGIPSTADGRFSQAVQPSTLYTRSEADVIFPTALINVSNQKGIVLRFRALIDACSDASYITESAAQKLQLSRTRHLVQTIGLGGNNTSASEFSADFKVQSTIQGGFAMKVSAYIIPKISSKRPVHQFQLKDVPTNLQWADPNFNVPSNIDLLLGGNLDAMISMSGCIHVPETNVVLKQTKLGWIVSGAVKQPQCFAIQTVVTDDSLSTLDRSMRRFWETEELETNREQTHEEQLSELIYETTTKRMDDGKYVVMLPFKKKVEPFSNMKKIAMSRFFQLERKLQRDPRLHNEYIECLNDYITMGHMTEVEDDQFTNPYFLPHHCVLKESSTTTKLRVVFDASAKDSNLNSLNDNLLNGPRLQADLLDLLLRFRTYKYAFTADIQQMYRQIWINPDDRQFQLILWRADKQGQIKTYALNTVTFGTTSAPYLAVKTLTRLAKDERSRFPLGATCLESGFYVDDFIYGANTIEHALNLQLETKSILKTAGFNLRKWSANHEKLLEQIPLEDRETKPLLSFEDSEKSVKTLGIHWAASDDKFHFKINLSVHKTHTKRTVLSDIAKIFDPLGWMAPSTIKAKLLIQQLWLKNKEWDQPLCPDLETEWLQLREQLPILENIKLPRWLGTSIPEHEIEIHGFADASEKAFAASVYVRTLGKRSTINLLFLKTKVAPLKKISLPRLELNAAHLLTKLVEHAKSVLNLENSKIYYWSDSTITLAWITDSPHKRTTYVANRVSDIQSKSSPASWYHVRSKENPADLGTRGILPSVLQDCDLWWHGPRFLETFNPTEHTRQPIGCKDLPEEEDKKEYKRSNKTKVLESFFTTRKISIVETLTNMKKMESNEILNKFSTLSKLCRVVAYCKRFIKSNRSSNIHISPTEYDEALLTILRMVQEESFSQEIEQLSSGKSVPKRSSIFSLCPMISDHDNLLRVHSRLGNADHLNYDQKFPIILPQRHFISLLIVRHAHNSTIHGTQQQTMLLVCQRYHIVRCKILVKKVIHHCIQCFKVRCQTATQQMAQLPRARVTPSRPFTNAGVDLAGPFSIKKWKGRCNSKLKSYFAIFICFSTKAVHLEVVVDLSTVEFIAANRRFIARRGTPAHIHSDCGTNFVGAASTITRSKREYLEKWNAEMAKEMAEFKTEWHFNPPASPHFGGFWEAGVKSAKYHLKRILGNASLSYDEFETILVQVEACMNSRPLVPFDGDPNSLVLTPSHFLMQTSVGSLPEVDLETIKHSTLDRWNYLQNLLQQFWKLWNKDVLNTLRQRKQWKTATKNVSVNDVVIIKDKNLPPCNWATGVVVKVHPGDDGLVRVVTVKSENSTLDRPIVKLCPLPPPIDL